MATATKKRSAATKSASKKGAAKKGATKKSSTKRSATKKSATKQGATKKSSTKKGATKKSAAKKGSAKKNKLGVKNSLVNNINAHKKKGDSKTRKKSSVDKKQYKKIGKQLGQDRLVESRMIFAV